MKHIEAVAAVILRDGKVFAAQRGPKGETAFKWEFPGGKIEAGETREAALERELREELSIAASIGPLFLSVDHRYRGFALTLHAYLARIASGEPVLAEHLATRWLSPEELDSVDWAAADIPIMEKLKRTSLE